MKKLVIEIELNNQAFEDPTGFEVSRILKEYSDSISEAPINHLDCNFHDINGNTVGSAIIKNMRVKKSY